MTTERLLEELRKQRERLSVTIHLIEEFQSMDSREAKRESIVKHVKKAKKWSLAQRAKFMATMKLKGKNNG